MFKKFNLLFVLAILVLTLQGRVLAADPNMIAIYWMDAGEGNVVWDRSGNGRNGTMNGAVLWSGAGMIGNCLEFNGGTVNISDNVDEMSFGDANRSFTAWIRTTANNQTFFTKVTTGLGNNYALGVGRDGATEGVFSWTYRNQASMDSQAVINDGEWHHVAFIQAYQEADGKEFQTIYIDGVFDAEQLTNITSDNGQGGMFIGQGDHSMLNNWSGSVDELYIYGSVLDGADIPFVMEGATWKPRARDLQPLDGAVLSGTTAELSWSPGWADTALDEHLAPDAHRVYLSTDVNAVTEGREEALVDTITDANTYSVADLIANTTYYWRIDEVNDNDATSPWTGEVLSFSVPDLAAKNPVPADGAKFQSLTVDLIWTPGLGATSHVVYIDNNADEVENATSGGMTVSDANYAPPGLQSDKVYFWRVDAVNSSVAKGPVWRFSTVPVGDGEHIDPNLVAWWKMNEGEGDTAVDYSGYGNHAPFVGVSNTRKPQWDEGIFGGGLRIWDGGGLGHLEILIEDFDSPEVTFGGWLYLEEAPPGWWPVFEMPTAADKAKIFSVGGSMRLSWPGANYTWVHGWDVDSGLEWPLNEWFYLGVSVKPDEATYYVNSETFVRSASFVPLTNLSTTGATLGGTNANAANTMPGLIDDWRIYDKALTADEIAEVMRGEPWLAWDPQPSHGSSVDVIKGSILSWQAGDGATGHDVYLATNPDALHNADITDTTGIYLGHNDLVNTMVTLADVNALTTYYWRVDEVQADGSIRKGNPWKFTVVDYLIIDDFEDYNSEDNQIWFAWHDGLGYGEAGTDFYLAGNGTGSSVGDENTVSYTEETIVQSGSQSMPLTYNNNQQGSAYYSEVQHTLIDVRDWTAEGVENLSLWFYGDPNNSAEPLYVAISNTTGQPAIVIHDDAAAVQTDTWTEWVVPLSVFADQGIVLTDVDMIAIGLGTQGNTTVPGGSGKILVDNIILMPTPAIDPNEPDEPDEPNNIVPEGDEYLVADFDTDGTGDNWLNNFGSGGRFTGRSLSYDTPDGSAASMQIDIDYSAGGWGSAWGPFSATGLGPEGTSSIDASGYTTFGCYMKSSIDGAQLDFWFEHFPGPTQGYVNQVTITGITTEWAYYEVALSTAVPARDGLHDMTAVNRMSFGGPADLGAPYTILLDQLRFINQPTDDVIPEDGNLLSNPGFETGTLDNSWNDGWGNRDINSNEQHTGSYCGHFSGGAVTQRDSLQLQPNTTYTYSGYVKSSGGNVSLGVKNHGADEMAVSTTSSTYELLSVTFTAGDDPSAAQVYVWCSGGTDGYADDLTLLYGP